MKNKRPRLGKNIKKKKRRALRNFLLLEGATLEELDTKMAYAESLGYHPVGPVNSTYDQFFQNHMIMVSRRRWRP